MAGLKKQLSICVPGATINVKILVTGDQNSEEALRRVEEIWKFVLLTEHEQHQHRHNEVTLTRPIDPEEDDKRTLSMIKSILEANGFFDN